MPKTDTKAGDRGAQDMLTGLSCVQPDNEGIKACWNTNTYKEEREEQDERQISLDTTESCSKTVLKNHEGKESMFTGQSSETRRLVVAISLSGSAVSFSLTAEAKQKHKNRHTLVSD